MAKKILVVDDEKDWVKILVMRLEKQGYEVEAAFDAIFAVAQANKVKPDLILLDIMMPAGGGLEALKNLRANFKTFGIPVIVATNKSDDETKETAENLGISGYYMKTEDIEKLVEKIREVLQSEEKSKTADEG